MLLLVVSSLVNNNLKKLWTPHPERNMHQSILFVVQQVPSMHFHYVLGVISCKTISKDNINQGGELNWLFLAQMAKVLRGKTCIHTGGLECPHGPPAVRAVTLDHRNSIFSLKAIIKKSVQIKSCRKSMRTVRHLLLMILR